MYINIHAALPTTDVGKKVFRVSCHLLFDSIVHIGAKRRGERETKRREEEGEKGGEMTMVDKRMQLLIDSLFSLLLKTLEKNDEALSAKSFYSWRLLGTTPSSLLSPLFPLSYHRVVSWDSYYLYA